MISNGDKIAVGVSGGKDSLTLLSFLKQRESYISISYTLYPIYIDLGFEKSFSKDLLDYCNDIGYDLKVDYTDYGVISHSSQNREKPCFLCSRLRRKRLFEIANKLGCHKLALGHNKDDIIETLFLNMFYSGQISTMVPYQLFFQGQFGIIRPLAFVDEDLIERFAIEKKLPNFENPCPSAKESKRSKIKSLLKELYAKDQNIKGNVFRAMSHVKLDYLLKK